ncbi:MAG: hypothetical protein Q9176_007361 [Flavoplaca citrina]
MSSKAGNIFAGGWTNQKAAVTRCKVCHKIQAIGNFSNKQQLHLKQKLAGQHGDKLRSPIAETIVCKKCTPGPNFEMICCICNIPKGLEAFSKAQRKDPDNARCLLCVNDHLTAPLAHVEQPEDDEDDDGSDGDDDYLDNRSTTNPYSSASYRPGSEVASATSGLGALNLSEHDRWYAADNKTASVHVSESDLLGPSIGSHKGKGKEKENVPSGYGARSVTGSDRSLQIITETSPGNSGSARPTVSFDPYLSTAGITKSIERG